MDFRPFVLACALLLAGCATNPRENRAGSPEPSNGGGEIYDFRRGTQPPKAVIQKAPEFPYEMRKRGIPGYAVVEFTVDTQGRVQRALAIRATTPEFGDAAVAAIKAWRFIPGIKDGRPVATRLQVPMTFNVEAPPSPSTGPWRPMPPSR